MKNLVWSLVATALLVGCATQSGTQDDYGKVSAEEVAASEPASPVPLKLRGTSVSSDPSESTAIIEDRRKRTVAAYYVGDEIAGATILEIDRTEVILDNQGEKVVISSFPGSIAPPSTGEAAQKGLFSLDLDNTDIRVMIKYVSDLLGKNFIIDNDVRGAVTVVAPTKISRDELYPVLESILEARGYVAVPAGEVIKVSSKRVGTRGNIQMGVGCNPEQIPSGDSLITQLIPLKYAPVNRVRNALGQLFSKDASVISYPETNTLIVTDLASRVRRLVNIIRELDVSAAEDRITVSSLRYAPADSLAAEIAQLFEETGEAAEPQTTNRRRSKSQSGKEPIRIVPEERTNSLLILADEDDTARVQKLIEELDRPGTGMDIREVIKTFSDLTGKNFIVGNAVRGSITVFTPAKLPEGSYLKSLETILEAYGFKMEPAGEFIKVVCDPLKSANQPVRKSGGSEEMQTGMGIKK